MYTHALYYVSVKRKVYSSKMLFNYVFRIFQLCYKSYHRLDYLSLQLVCMELHTYGLHRHSSYIIMYKG